MARWTPNGNDGHGNGRLDGNSNGNGGDGWRNGNRDGQRNGNATAMAMDDAGAMVSVTVMATEGTTE